jgi:hypothetical protein
VHRRQTGPAESITGTVVPAEIAKSFGSERVTARTQLGADSYRNLVGHSASELATSITTAAMAPPAITGSSSRARDEYATAVPVL